MPDYSSLPSVTALASIPELADYPERIRILASQAAISALRSDFEKGKKSVATVLAVDAAKNLSLRSLQKVFNFSGVILHTGLGRAPIEPPIIGEAYTNLEFDLETGKRGDRQDHVRGLLCRLTGAEDALVVNNAAAAVLLTLTALCKGKQVLLSRGESVEIGGSFRMPEIVKASGCKLVDIGATNKTYASDYAEAITSQTGAILRCHPSNYEITGFTDFPNICELKKVAEECGVLFINDQGNGALIDFSRYGIQGIDTLPTSVATGADISIASSDKLLGGPQCGIIVGRKDLIKKIAKHPIARAVRIDKISLLTLESVLHWYQAEKIGNITLHRILSIPAETIKIWCELMAPEGALVEKALCELGSGSGAGKGVASYAVVLKSDKPDRLLKELRYQKIIGRIHTGAVWLDPRCEETIYHSRKPDASNNTLKHFKTKITECWEKWR
jgi:L-seryl-tRNA(Ser) seleniumtransferase